MKGSRPAVRDAVVRAALGVALAAAFVAACSSPARALSFDTTGWWRTRYFYEENTPLNPATGNNLNTEFLDYRFALYPTLGVTDEIKLKARVDILDNVIWGNNDNEPSILTGLAKGTSSFDRALKPVEEVQINHLYGEIRTPVGLLRVGRQPSNFGLGILANGGGSLEWGPDGNGPEAGDTVDRALFLTDLGVPMGWHDQHLITAVAYDRTVELDVFQQGDDVNDFILANLYTDGSISPRVTGDTEAGIYSVLVTKSASAADVGLQEGYFHVRREVSEGFALFMEGEGVVAFGSSKRSGLVPNNKRQDFIDSIKTGLEGQLGSFGDQIADHGTDIGLVANAVAKGLVDNGLSPKVAQTIATEGASAGFDVARDEPLDIFLGGGVVRGGMESGPLRLTGEWGYSSGGDGKNALINFVGPVAGKGPEAKAAVAAQENDALGAALTGTKVGSYPFDTEYDVAVILYHEVGPLEPVNLQPDVHNTTYLKGTGEWKLDDATRLWSSLIWGELNRGVETYHIVGADDGDPTTPVTVVSDGTKKDLGVEIDWGIDRKFGDNLRAEIKMGYLFVGSAFGPTAQDIFMVRPQLAVIF